MATPFPFLSRLLLVTLGPFALWVRFPKGKEKDKGRASVLLSSLGKTEGEEVAPRGIAPFFPPLAGIGKGAHAPGACDLGLTGELMEGDVG